MNVKATSIEGSVLGVIFSLLAIALMGVPDETLLFAYALLLLLFSAYLTSSPRMGALFGLFAIIGESVMDFVYFVFVSGLQVSLVPYAAGLFLFLGRIPIFLILGALGGYLGREYFAEKLRVKGKSGRLRS